MSKKNTKARDGGEWGMAGADARKFRLRGACGPRRGPRVKPCAQAQAKGAALGDGAGGRGRGTGAGDEGRRDAGADSGGPWGYAPGRRRTRAGTRRAARRGFRNMPSKRQNRIAAGTGAPRKRNADKAAAGARRIFRKKSGKRFADGRGEKNGGSAGTTWLRAGSQLGARRATRLRTGPRFHGPADSFPRKPQRNGGSRSPSGRGWPEKQEDGGPRQRAASLPRRPRGRPRPPR